MVDHRVQWASAISTESDSQAAVEEVLAALTGRLDGKPTVAFLFASPHHRGAYRKLPGDICFGLGTDVLVGCSGGGIIGDGQEIEGKPALSVMIGYLPGVTAEAVLVVDSMNAKLLDPAGFVLFADPFSVNAEGLVKALDDALPDTPKVGGLVSGGTKPGDNALFLGDRYAQHGAVVLSLSGDIVLDTIVAQGCKPIGEPMMVTSCEGNRILELDSRKPGDVVLELHQSIDPEDQALFSQSLFIGVEMKDQREYSHGDFLIRNLLGLSADGASLSVAAPTRRWQVVQFHLRHARASAEDLALQLQRYGEGDWTPSAGLLFSCLGRGEFLYGRPNHDSDALTEAVGRIPLGGFFCNGEIGPVGGSTFVHGYTSAFGLFREP